MPFASNLKTLLDLRGINQTQLAANLRVSRPAVTQWVSGKTTPRGKRLSALAQALGVTAAQLLDAEHISQPDPRKPPSEPKPGQFIEDPNELALLAFWRALNRDEKAFMTSLLRNGALSPRKSA